MTRTYSGLVHCPRCGEPHTAETAFERWVRLEPKLDSREYGLVRFDCDMILHQYKRGVSRDVQCLMFVEIKTFSSEMTPAQHDTLSLFSQLLRKQDGAMSPIAGRVVQVRMFGGHLLQLSHDDPTISAWMMWDNKPISVDQLIGLLRFDLNPDSLGVMD